MALPLSIKIPSSPDPITAVFGEATSPEQRLGCYELGATGFRPPLTTEQYVKREQFVDKLPLTRGTGWRFWCLYNTQQPMQILATCKTIVRDLIIRDASGVRLERGYCIASVVSDEAHRGHGLASFMLKKVAEWMDGPGEGAVSFLYTRYTSFYEPRGWAAHPSLELLITFKGGKPAERGGLPSTKLLRASDLPYLCQQDTERLASQIHDQEATPDATTVAVQPTADLVSWLHGRSDFYALTLHDRLPDLKGSIVEAANMWLYWHHDFQRNRLVIQRISGFRGGETDIKALVSLLLDARAEASAWNLSAVSIWSPDDDIEAAGRHLSELVPNDVIQKVERESDITMVRHAGGNGTKQVVVAAHEFYAWN